MKTKLFTILVVLLSTIFINQTVFSQININTDKIKNKVTNNNSNKQKDKKVELTKPSNIKNENVLIAVGKPVYGQSQGCIYRSVDEGQTWTKVLSSFDYTPVSVAYGNELFVAISASKVALSYTGEADTWTEVDISDTYVSSGSFDPQAIAFGNGFFVMCGGSGTLCYSKDGYNWKYIGEPDDMNVGVSHFKNIEFINGKFYVTGNCNRIITLVVKDDKVVKENAAKFSTDAGDYFSFVAKNNTNYITGRFSFYKSTDGTNWKQYEPSTSGSSKLIKVLNLENNLYVGAKEMGGISVSKDNGNTLENANGIEADATYATHIKAMCIVGSKIVAIGHQTNIWVSTDGINWTSVANKDFEEIRFAGMVYSKIGK